MSELETLKSQLKKVESQLEKYRLKVAEYSMSCPKTQKRWKSERNWDYYAKEKFRLQGLIEDLEQIQNEHNEISLGLLFCVNCQAMFEEECCCSENEE